MSRRTKTPIHHEELNIWSAFTDLMANAFMILTFFLFLTVFKSVIFQSNSEQIENNLKDSQQKIENLKNSVASLQGQLKKESSKNTKLTRQIDQLKAPPVVIIEDSGDYKFSSGSAELSPKLKEDITNTLVDKIEQITRERDIYVVEVIGHTDGQINSRRSGNLDNILEKVANGDTSVKLEAGSNADLGLMRALAVVKTLQEIQRTGRLQGLQFRAYSAAQLLGLNGEFAPINREPDTQRRRIEIRFSPLGQAEKIR